MSNILDSLIFTSIRNNIPNTDIRFNNILKKSGITTTNTDLQDQIIQNQLVNSTIKRACCMAKNSNEANMTDDKKYYKIDVKIPLPKNYKASNFENKFGYTTKTVLVPKDYCTTYFDPNFNISGTDFSKCQNFYVSYCENMKYLFNLENNGQYDPDTFYKYIGECACMADLPDNSPAGVPNSCFLENCSQGNTESVFLDDNSRKNVCSASFCTAITKVGNISASSEAQLDFSNKVNQVCGQSKTNSSPIVQPRVSQQQPSQLDQQQQPSQQSSTVASQPIQQPSQQSSTVASQQQQLSQQLSTTLSQSSTITSQPSQQQSTAKLSTSAIIGISVCICCCLCICLIIILVIMRSNKKKL